MKIYYDDDANLELIKKLNVTIIGYGSQGHAHANNLKDSGVDVTVGLREGSSSWSKASEAGLKVMTVDQSVLNADLVMILAPDEFQKGVFEKSILALKQLNSFGYGLKEKGLLLNLVYNPNGPQLPPSQIELEDTYKRELKERYGIYFTNLFVFVAIPEI